MAKRLYRSRTDAVLGGVCGGLGDYFSIDSSVVRVVFVILSVLTGFGVLAYLALWLLIPEEGRKADDLPDRVRDAAEEIADRARSIGSDFRRSSSGRHRSAAFAVGIALVIIGLSFLLHNLGVTWMRWFGLRMLWPVFPILIGLAFLWRWLRGGE